MAQTAPKNTQTIEESQAEQARNKRVWLVGLVDPQGVVREQYIGPDKDANNGHRHGIDVAYYAEGEVRLTAYGKRAGWTRLEDRCSEDDCPEVYEMWKDTVLHRLDGHPIVLPKDEDGGFDMSAIYPPSVIAQRRSGHRVAGKPKAFIPGKGMVEIDEMTEEQVASRRERLASQIGEEKKKGGRRRAS